MAATKKPGKAASTLSWQVTKDGADVVARNQEASDFLCDSMLDRENLRVDGQTWVAKLDDDTVGKRFPRLKVAEAGNLLVCQAGGGKPRVVAEVFELYDARGGKALAKMRLDLQETLVEIDLNTGRVSPIMQHGDLYAALYHQGDRLIVLTAFDLRICRWVEGQATCLSAVSGGGTNLKAPYGADWCVIDIEAGSKAHKVYSLRADLILPLKGLRVKPVDFDFIVAGETQVYGLLGRKRMQLEGLDAVRPDVATLQKRLADELQPGAANELTVVSVEMSELERASTRKPAVWDGGSYRVGWEPGNEWLFTEKGEEVGLAWVRPRGAPVKIKFNEDTRTKILFNDETPEGLKRDAQRMVASVDLENQRAVLAGINGVVAVDLKTGATRGLDLGVDVVVNVRLFPSGDIVLVTMQTLYFGSLKGAFRERILGGGTSALWIDDVLFVAQPADHTAEGKNSEPRFGPVPAYNRTKLTGHLWDERKKDRLEHLTVRDVPLFEAKLVADGRRLFMHDGVRAFELAGLGAQLDKPKRR